MNSTRVLMYYDVCVFHSVDFRPSEKKQNLQTRLFEVKLFIHRYRHTVTNLLPRPTRSIVTLPDLPIRILYEPLLYTGYDRAIASRAHKLCIIILFSSILFYSILLYIFFDYLFNLCLQIILCLIL